MTASQFIERLLPLLLTIWTFELARASETPPSLRQVGPMFSRTGGNASAERFLASVPASLESRRRQLLPDFEDQGDSGLHEMLILARPVRLTLDQFKKDARGVRQAFELRISPATDDRALDVQEAVIHFEAATEAVHGHTLQLIELHGHSRLLIGSQFVFTSGFAHAPIRMDITDAVARWFDTRTRTAAVATTLVLECRSCSNPVELAKPNKVMLEVYQSERKRRAARSLHMPKTVNHIPSGAAIVNKCPEIRSMRQCCTEPLTIDTRIANLDNSILRPQRLPVNYCSGLCMSEPANFNFRHLLMSHVKQRKGAPHISSCCYPTKFGGLKVAYLRTDNEVVVEYIHDMTILECKCS